MSKDPRSVHRKNAEAWNETSDWYASRTEGVRELLATGGSTLQDQEQKLLSLLPPMGSWCDVAIHLQCAAGFDTISLANLGARTAVGVDISSDLISVARRLAGEIKSPVEFYCADVLEVSNLDGTADLVYTGKGALHWMFDLPGWARKVTALLKPGGWFLVFDFHPMMWLFQDGRDGLEINPISYFAPIVSYNEWAPGHFTEPNSYGPSGAAPKRLRPWPPSAVIQSLIDAGLQIALFHEYPDNLTSNWSAFPLAPEAERKRIASTYAVMARKPEDR